MKFLEDILKEPLFVLPEDSETKKAFPVGTVIWWNIAQGVGAVQTGRGAARAHWSQIAAGKRKFRYLLEGERIHCNVVPLELREDSRPSTFKWEAQNITPLA